jgi:hypothetical protein
MKRRMNSIRRAYLLVSDTAYYWRRGYRIRMAWHLAKIKRLTDLD